MLPPTVATSFRQRPSIVLFGDSITQFGFGTEGCETGWASLLSASYTRRCDVLNRGFSGYNTRHALDIVPDIFPMEGNKVDALFCTIFFGANDAALPGERQHVPIKEYKKNVEQLLTSIRSRCTLGSEDRSLPILLMTPPPVDERAWSTSNDAVMCDRSNEITKQYGDCVKEIAARNDRCSIVDTWQLLQGDSPERSSFLSDGLHLNEEGNRVVYQGLMDVIQRDFPHVAPLDPNCDAGGDGKGVALEGKIWKELC